MSTPQRFLTYGDTNEPDVSEQLEPIQAPLIALRLHLDALTTRLDRAEAAELRERYGLAEEDQ